MKYTSLVVASVAFLSACQSGPATTTETSMMPTAATPDPSPTGPVTTTGTSTVRGHFFAVNLNEDEEMVSIRDRSATASVATVSVHSVDGEPRTADISVAGPLGGGSVVPGRTGLRVDSSASSFGIVAAEGDDAFLGSAAVGGQHYGLGAYVVIDGNVGFVGLGMTGNETQSMPTTGQATFRGEMAGVVAGDVTGVEAVTSNLTMNTTFTPSGGSISGRTADMITEGGSRVGIDVVLGSTAIQGNRYEGGSLSLMAEGTDTPVGAVTSSDYQGAFYGPGAAETAGSFQIEATGIPIINGGGATQRVQAIGAFGAAR